MSDPADSNSPIPAERGAAPQVVGSTAPPVDPVEAVRKINQQAPGASFGLNLALGMQGNPVLDKVNETHITLSLQTAQEQANNAHDFKKRKLAAEQWQFFTDAGFQILIFVGGVALVIFVVVEFRGQPEILKSVLPGIGGFFAGMLGGFGLGKGRANKAGKDE